MRLTTKKIESAIDYFASNIPEDILKEAFEGLKQSYDFSVEEHFDLGIYVRNLLRRGGFDFEGVELDSN